jgi:hypothetical protein
VVDGYIRARKVQEVATRMAMMVKLWAGVSRIWEKFVEKKEMRLKQHYSMRMALVF